MHTGMRTPSYSWRYKCAFKSPRQRKKPYLWQLTALFLYNRISAARDIYESDNAPDDSLPVCAVSPDALHTATRQDLDQALDS